MLRSPRLKVKSGLATTAVFNPVENKIPNVSDLVKRTDCGAKIANVEAKYFPHLITINLRIKYYIKR